MKFIFAIVLTLATFSAQCANPTLAGNQTFTGNNTFSASGNSFQGTFSAGSGAESMTPSGGFSSGINGHGFSDISGDGFKANSLGGFVDNGGGGFVSQAGGGFTDNGNVGFVANGNNGFTDNSTVGIMELGGGNIQIAGAAGKFIGNGGGLTNLPAASIAHQLIQTNFVSGKLYTNNYGAVIQVSANAILIMTGVAGAADLELQIPSVVTNRVATSTLITSLATSSTNSITAFVPIGSAYTFTNNSSGTGDSATVIGGQIFY